MEIISERTINIIKIINIIFTYSAKMIQTIIKLNTAANKK